MVRRGSPVRVRKRALKSTQDECAIHALAPVCEHCDCRVIGHGVEADSRIFCCAHCATEAGVAGLADRA
jgi:hypothetical protein